MPGQLKKQSMSIHSREMCPLHLRYVYLSILILTCLGGNHAHSNRNAQRTIHSSGGKSVGDAIEKSIGQSFSDQVALAAGEMDDNVGDYSANEKADYTYSNLEMSVIQPESKPIHSRITAEYSSSSGPGPSSLEDAETAEEYVAKAMQSYGARLHRPIHIPVDLDKDQQSNQGAIEGVGDNSQNDYYDLNNKEQQQLEQQEPQQKLEQSNANALRNVQLQQTQFFDQASENNNELAKASFKYPSDPVTRSYEVYDKSASNEGLSNVDRYYRTKYVYQPTFHGASTNQESNQAGEEKIRVSASTEIPKAEIMKQIEKSVIKYIKELEAEGKIITAPQEPQQIYYKEVSVPVAEKHVSAATIKPKYTTPNTYHTDFSDGAGTSSEKYGSASRHHKTKQSAKRQQPYRSETESAYQTPKLTQNQVSDEMVPNVEFVYKLKTRAPLQTATVKTVSKPYTLPFKMAPAVKQFDHSAVLKSMEEFDLSHVVTPQESEEQSGFNEGGTSVPKPKKLYFNSEIYQDINSLPFKGENVRSADVEYRKLKESDALTNYKGYGGHFGEPTALSEEADQELESAAFDEGYPIMNPYKFVLKKEPSAGKYEEANFAAASSAISYNSKPVYSTLNGQKALEFDSYSPKFNNNPEGYGYQHNHKVYTSVSEPQLGGHTKYAARHTSGGKRGKRGGVAHPHANQKVSRNKDLEANLALRPPPKVKV